VWISTIPICASETTASVSDALEIADELNLRNAEVGIDDAVGMRDSHSYNE